MKNYETVFILNPVLSVDQAKDTVDKFVKVLTDGKADVINVEQWGLKKLAYPIQKIHKAHYVLMNIESDQETLAELEHAFKFNDAVLRHLTIKMKKAVTTPSPMMKDEKSRSLTSGRSDGDASAKDGEASETAAQE